MRKGRVQINCRAVPRERHPPDVLRIAEMLPGGKAEPVIDERLRG